jgi:hypothetical protein
MSSLCEPIYVCDVSYSATTIQTSSAAACTSSAAVTAAARVRRANTKLTDISEDFNPDSFIRKRVTMCTPFDLAIIYPLDATNPGDIATVLADPIHRLYGVLLGGEPS